MSEYSSSEEVRAAKIAAMGTQLGELHFELWNEVTWIHLKWKDFRALFATRETVELLNQVAPDFFDHLNSILWEDVLLHLCRLTDIRKSTGHQANLTIQRLPRLIRDPKIEKRIKLLTEDAVQKTEFARDWRNRRIAHREVPEFGKSAPKPLAAASRHSVEGALASIREVMNCVESHYQQSPVAYEHSIGALGGVDSLLAYLRRGSR